MITFTCDCCGEEVYICDSYDPVPRKEAALVWFGGQRLKISVEVANDPPSGVDRHICRGCMHRAVVRAFGT